MYKKGNGMYIKVKENKGMRTCVLFLFLDKSGSVTTKEGSIYDAFTNLMEKLAKQNETALDMQIKVVLLTFDNNVHVFNPNNTPLRQNRYWSYLSVKITSVEGERVWLMSLRNWIGFSAARKMDF